MPPPLLYPPLLCPPLDEEWKLLLLGDELRYDGVLLCELLLYEEELLRYVDDPELELDDELPTLYRGLFSLTLAFGVVV